MSVRILIVDDNKDTIRTYKKALTRLLKPNEWDFSPLTQTSEAYLEIEEAESVQQAVKKLHSKQFEILIVDLKIPGSAKEEMGGLEVISESIRLDQLRPVIVITGYGTVELSRKTFTNGVFDFIEKSETAIDELVSAIQRALITRNEKMIRSGNPFTRMSGIEPAIFGGRTAELEFFEQRLYRASHTKFCEHFLVLGDWGIGKSTLFKEYKKLCNGRGHLASVVLLESLQPGTKQIDAARSIIEGILRDLPVSENRFKKVTSYFDSVGINILGSGLEFSRDTSKNELSPQAFLHDTLLSLWQDLKDKTDVFTILLDDLDNFMTVPEVIMTLKQTLSMDSLRKTKILLGITATKTAWNNLTSSAQHHPLSRYFISRAELAPLNETELQETVLKSLTSTGVSFSQDIIKQVYDYTEGHPFEMQVLCYHLFSNQLSRRVDREVWDKALQVALRDLGVAVFDYWFNQASVEETKVLRIIADSGEPIPARDVQKKAEKASISPRNISKYLQRLIEKNLILKTGRGLYTIPDRMFRAYIQSIN